MRLKKWATIFLWATGVPVTLLLFVVGKAIYSDIPKAVDAAKAEINGSKESALSDIAKVREQLPPLQEQVQQIRTDAGKYQRVNDDIGRLQRGLQQVKGDIVDLGHKTLKTGPIEASGGIRTLNVAPGESYIGFSPLGLGCSAKEFHDVGVAYCAKGQPLELNQLIPGGSIRPVASYSDMGFQDMSTLPKKECTNAMRGTIYIEKGGTRQPDKAYLCVREETGAFRWALITTEN